MLAASTPSHVRISEEQDVKARQHIEHFTCVDSVPIRDFTRLMANCALLVGNSSAGVREAGVFGTPVVNVGSRQVRCCFGFPSERRLC